MKIKVHPQQVEIMKKAGFKRIGFSGYVLYYERKGIKIECDPKKRVNLNDLLNAFQYGVTMAVIDKTIIGIEDIRYKVKSG